MSLETWELLLLAVTGLVSLLFLYSRWKDGYFSRKGVKSPTTYLPFVGHMMGILRRQEHFKDLVNKLYNSFPEEKYVGFHRLTVPLVMVKDIEVLKQIVIKDFDCFSGRLAVIDEEADPLFGKNLFSLGGQKWRNMRATLSPAFTSAKMRGMFGFVTETAQQTADFYIDEMKKPENKVKGFIEVEMKDAFTRYANDIIATTVFGLKVNSLEDRDNEFYVKGKESTDFFGAAILRLFVVLSLPSVAKWFKITFISDSVKRFFSTLFVDTMQERKDNEIVRNDMIQLLMEAKKGSLKHEKAFSEDTKEEGFATVGESSIGKEVVSARWSNDDIIAQALLFFMAGYDTSSTLLCFLAHVVMLHQDIQDRLREEVDEVAASSGGTVSYNDLQNMKCMDMVVSETLRFWPPAVAMDRKCSKPYWLPPSNSHSKPVQLRTIEKNRYKRKKLTK